MTICVVIDNQTNQLVNTIVAEPSDLAPEGCRLIEVLDGYYWDGNAVVPIPPPLPEVISGN
jgi:hypothetical protein